MYYWMSWFVHFLLVLSASTLGFLTWRHHRLKPRVSKKKTVKAAVEAIESVEPAEEEQLTIDPNVLR